MYGIQNKTYTSLIRYFFNENDIKRVILFGSRAKATYTYNSDIDLYISYYGDKPYIIMDQIHDLAGIYSVDIVFEENANSVLKDQILRDGITIYDQNETVKRSKGSSISI
ncbi:nucleotidyltransferase family protein [Gracilibacillus salinarum]|uniref:Nucleotidyltransferase domain-containing protein n=1 Tax=Gracilibacillus salinarum TaxID=2932255 RepID=A0ABY4GJT6_9BACI|nr:nucleotidyltransferase domain-containing protein [Gracilibacillus salinarum]UOQ84610.1 nucleotidyltransferase domain-containing protein [Gracilibacillus salinarum]